MESYIHAAILGLVQGVTEFLPISSSGHLVVVPRLFGWEDQGVIFDIALHLATLLAVVIYFRTDIRSMVRGLLTKRPTRDSKLGRQLAIQIGLATIPILIAGLLLMNFINTSGRSVPVVAGLMIFVGLLFILIEKIAVPRKDLGKLVWSEALAVGIAQAAALLPGVSRSGATIVTGIYNGLKREAATRFSFLLAIPAILMAGGYSVIKLFTDTQPMTYSWAALGVGFAAAFLSGLAAISFMMYFMKRSRLTPFAYYRIVFGLGLLGLYFFSNGIFN